VDKDDFQYHLLRVVVLKRSCHGYKIAQIIEEKYGAKSVGPRVYAGLKKLFEDGLLDRQIITTVLAGPAKFDYKATPIGLKSLCEIAAQRRLEINAMDRELRELEEFLKREDGTGDKPATP
jgi:DNA-binding PadR family transcriptional regulator